VACAEADAADRTVFLVECLAVHASNRAFFERTISSMRGSSFGLSSFRIA